MVWLTRQAYFSGVARRDCPPRDQMAAERMAHAVLFAPEKAGGAVRLSY